MSEPQQLPVEADDQPKPPTTGFKKPSLVIGGDVAAIVPTSFEETYRLANILAACGDMVPQHFQGAPDKIAAAVMMGMEIGLKPMQSLQNIAVINGRPTIWGDALPALLLSAGHILDHEMVGEGNQMKAVATLTRGDTGKVFTREFSMHDAEKAGLLKKQGPWQQYPRRMLAMRARSWAARDGAADVLKGLHVSDERKDLPPGPDHARDVTPRGSRRRVSYDTPSTPSGPEVSDAVISGEAGNKKPSLEEIQAAMQKAEAAVNARDEGDDNAEPESDGQLPMGLS